LNVAKSYFIDAHLNVASQLQLPVEASIGLGDADDRGLEDTRDWFAPSGADASRAISALQKGQGDFHF
jgi:hypothetical protein